MIAKCLKKISETVAINWFF